MKDLDQKIQAALRRETAGGIAAEPNLAQEVITAAFRGRHRAISTIAFVISFLFFVGAVWSAIEFYRAEAVVAQLRWGGLALLLMLLVSFIKVWFWLEMHSNRILREVKRLELLLISRAQHE